MDLSIIIVNWNSKDYLRNCIDSILAATQGIDYEIVVIDNASFDGCDKMLQQHYPKVHFIQSEKNLGFAKANNVAYRESSGRCILFLNPDTELVSPAINIMFDYLQKVPNVGVIGCKLLNADKTVQSSCVQAFPTILNQFLDSEILRSFWPKSSLWGNAPIFGAQIKLEEVDVISGACIMVKRMIFELVELFSEEYFMYAEDLDLCYKIREAGYINYFIPNAIVIHFGAGSTEMAHREFSVVMMHESVWRFMRKTRGKIYGIAYRCSTLISAISRLALLMMYFPLHLIRPERKSWYVSFKKWKAILTWSLGLKGLVLN